MQWFRQWAERRRLRRRALFRFRGGDGVRYVDPAEVWRKLLSHPKMDFVAMAPLAEQGKEPETSIVLDALCEIFGVRRWDESTKTGMTSWEILALIREFDEYLTALKKNTSPSRMPWQLLAYGLSSGPVTPEADSPTSPTSESSSMPIESTPGDDTSSSEPFRTV